MTDAERAEFAARTLETAVTAEAGSQASIASAAAVLGAFEVLAETMAVAAEELGRIDAVAGDGDHGIGMARGSRAAEAAAREARDAQLGAGSVLVRAGDAWADVAGGTSGALWGAALRAVGDVFGDEDAVDVERVARAVSAARDAIAARGGAKLGDKTMMDVLIPFAERVEAMLAAGTLDAAAWAAAGAFAKEAAEATRPLVPKIGRARPLAERSVGTPDAGAVSLSMIIVVLTDHLTKTR